MADDLSALRALLARASPGPWTLPAGAPGPIHAPSGEPLLSPAPAARPEDCALAAAARTGLPRLLEALARTEALRDELQAQLDALHEQHAALLARHQEMERVLGEALRRARGEAGPPGGGGGG